MMKYLFCSVLFVFVLCSGYAQKGFTNEKELIEVAFNSSMDEDDLDSIQTKLLEKGIDIIYKKATYSKDRKLAFISFEVDCNDGFSGSASQYFLTDKARAGFRRDYRKGSKVPFKTGGL